MSKNDRGETREEAFKRMSSWNKGDHKMIKAEVKDKLKAFAEGYIACAQTHEGIDDEWEDYLDYCLNFYNNGEEVTVSVYPLIHYQNEAGKHLTTQDTSDCLISNLLETTK